MVDDEIYRLQGIDLIGVASHFDHRVTHDGEIHNARNASEVLQKHTSRHEGNFLVRGGFCVPADERFDILSSHDSPILVAQQILEENLQRNREPVERSGKRFFEALQRKNGVSLSANSNG